ncbi:Hypothetical protein Minf_1875 [Methylacidiphilum infernorum V4]|uniref:Uncharacterized protein n=1 Tax=Methylacidiphilum infernorum (isolate V4) TaxID=481448 RepID=B3DXX7_METI4|nr:Hypothetical protein Minf_1875 [Methylacidiphilum infernorum V4]
MRRWKIEPLVLNLERGSIESGENDFFLEIRKGKKREEKAYESDDR